MNGAFNEIILLEEVYGLSQEDIAEELGVTFSTINKWKKDRNFISREELEKIYSFAYRKDIKINLIFEQFLKERINKENNILLFHGSRNEIKFPITLKYSKESNDFGKGFYLGENFEQALTYVATNSKSKVYSFALETKKLKSYRFYVDTKRMIAIAYFRKQLEKYSKSMLIQGILKELDGIDYIIAPIADNRMFDIIKEFVNGDITDLQCQYALAATNLGNQYVLRTNKAIEAISFLKEFYVCQKEREIHQTKKNEKFYLNQDKVKLSRIEYRGKGKYIYEVLK